MDGIHPVFLIGCVHMIDWHKSFSGGCCQWATIMGRLLVESKEDKVLGAWAYFVDEVLFLLTQQETNYVAFEPVHELFTYLCFSDGCSVGV